jgi:predicted nucleic acid-binding protein
MSTTQPLGLVDLLRKYPPAYQWLKTQPALGVPSIAWMELIFGAQNKLAQQQCLNVLGLFDVVPLQEPDNSWAMNQLLKFRLGYNVGISDCLIASISSRLQLPVYTQP